MASQRKSARRKQPSKNYSVDPFEGLDIGDELDHGTSAAHARSEESGDDGDFQVEAHASPEPADEELLDTREVEAGDLDDDAIEQDLDDDDSLIGASDPEAPRFHGPRKRKRPEYGKAKSSRAAADPRFQPRGLLEPATRGSKEVQRLFMFGPRQEDQGPPLQGHFKWSAEPTTPSRKATSSGFGGFSRSYFVTADAMKKEAQQDWEWYELDGGKEAFQARQVTSTLDATQAQAYMPSISEPALPFLMGPFKHQKLFRLPVGSSIDLNEAWIPDSANEQEESPSQDPGSVRYGWMLNLGQKVQSLEWAPNNDGTRQFLAVSTVPVVDTRNGERPYENSSAPAFTAQPPHKSSIQIWEFVVGDEGRVSLQHRPKLRRVICTNWGDVRSLKWCPTPRKFEKSTEGTHLTVGLLGALFGDGSVRVLDVAVTTSPTVDTEYTHLQATAFATCPPNTICTCLTWLSSTSIAAGCANGTLGVWNIASSLKDSPQPSSNDFAEPVIYASLATTYILGLISCYPSRPHILLATTMAGHLYMIDLTDMPSSTTFGPAVTIRSTRSRIGRSILVWHDWSQMVLSADDNFTLVAYPLRRFFRQIGCTRYKSSAMTVAVSPVHPFVLAGCVGGEVTCNNPLRRAYESKVPIWNQIWFTHEWREGKPNDPILLGTTTSSGNEDAAMGNAGPETDGQARSESSPEDVDKILKTGMSRILEGFKCDQIKLFNTEDAFTHRENGAIYTTVYEVKTSVTTVGWNPNIHVGGWVAAGMASGLLRVEDIAS